MQLEAAGRENVPAGHMEHAVLPIIEYCPPLQDKQLDGEVPPTDARYLPASQVVIPPALGQKAPAGQSLMEQALIS